jgi:hypothetical protein
VARARLLVCVWAIVLVFDPPRAVLAWPAGLGNYPLAVVADVKGNLFAALNDRRIVKLSGVDGRQLWRRHPRGSGEEGFSRLVPAPNGDVVAAGAVTNAEGDPDFAVIRLAGRDGRERWRRAVASGVPRAGETRGYALAIASDEDIAAAGTIALPRDLAPAFSTAVGFIVLNLDSVTGLERWRFLLDAAGGIGHADVVAFDARKDVFAAGYRDNGATSTLVVVKLAGETGMLLWRRDFDALSGVRDLAVDGAGDVVLAVVGSAALPLSLLKLSGASGEVRWIRDGPDTQAGGRVLVDAAGTVFAAGGSGDGFTVVRLNGLTGDREWTYHTSGTDGGGSATDFALHPAGFVIAAGLIRNVRSCADGLVVALRESTGKPSWARTFDGTYVGPCEACDDFDHGGRCPEVDYDYADSLVVGRRGQLFAHFRMVNGGVTGARISDSIRELRFPRVSR